MHDTSLKTLLDAILSAMQDKLLGNPTLTIGSVSKKTLKTLAFPVSDGGTLKTIAAATPAFTATDDDIADGYKAVYLIYLVDTTVTVLKGTAVLIADTAVCPAIPAGGIKVGEVEIETSGAIFNATSDDLDAAHLTVTYRNLGTVLELA